MSATVRVGGVNAELRNPTAERLPVVGGPLDGQWVRNIPGSPRAAVLYGIGGPLSGRGYDYRWDGAAYVPDPGAWP